MKVVFDVTEGISHFAWAKDEAAKHEARTGKAAEILLPTLKEIQEDVGEKITEIGVIRGPGSFTGIRVGLSTALGLKTSLGIPVMGFDKYALLHPHMAQKTGALILPSGKREVLWLAYEDGKAVGAPCIYKKDRIPDAKKWLPYPIEGVEGCSFDLCFASMALKNMLEGAKEDEFSLEPMYIRPPDAKKNKSLLERLLTSEG